jgi:hypothetical protein
MQPQLHIQVAELYGKNHQAAWDGLIPPSHMPTNQSIRPPQLQAALSPPRVVAVLCRKHLQDMLKIARPALAGLIRRLREDAEAELDHRYLRRVPQSEAGLGIALMQQGSSENDARGLFWL